MQGTLDEIACENDTFDGIFAYSSILFTDYRKTLKEFHRVLKSGGKLYFNANGLGWYLYNIIDEHNSTNNFSSRQMGIDTIKNSLKFYSTGSAGPGDQIIMIREIIIDEMEKIGYQIVAQGGEGTINLQKDIKINPFFKSEYYDQDGVFEILAIKK